MTCDVCRREAIAQRNARINDLLEKAYRTKELTAEEAEYLIHWSDLPIELIREFTKAGIRIYSGTLSLKFDEEFTGC